jgi:hypothetical protein
MDNPDPILQNESVHIFDLPAIFFGVQRYEKEMVPERQKRI